MTSILTISAGSQWISRNSGTIFTVINDYQIEIENHNQRLPHHQQWILCTTISDDKHLISSCALLDDLYYYAQHDTENMYDMWNKIQKEQ